MSQFQFTRVCKITLMGFIIWSSGGLETQAYGLKATSIKYNSFSRWLTFYNCHLWISFWNACITIRTFKIIYLWLTFYNCHLWISFCHACITLRTFKIIYLWLTFYNCHLCIRTFRISSCRFGTFYNCHLCIRTFRISSSRFGTFYNCHLCIKTFRISSSVGLELSAIVIYA